MPRDERLYLSEIAHAIERIRGYMSGGRHQFFRSTVTHDEVLPESGDNREAARHVSEETRSRASMIPWRSVIGLRDELIHGYFETDLEVVWQVVEHDLDALHSAIRKLLQPDW